MEMKLLTRIRLINWHYFRDETININKTTLISGENTAGKSTILDAVQLVLTTNTRKFNIAANEKGNRNLRGYVRCKVGNAGETYLRKNVVISNVALEFYDEKTKRYFVMGVHMYSQDEESRVLTKWYIEECRFDEFSFITEGKPSMADEFKKNGAKIKYIDQLNAAKDRFKRRMGNLEDKFFDIIPKSLAFKPMDNVKDFINKFVLTEEKIDVQGLRVNIETLSELEELMEKSHRQLSMLNEIMDKYDMVMKKEKDITVNELLIQKAEIEHKQGEVKRLRNEISKFEQYIASNLNEADMLSKQIIELDSKLLALNISADRNEASRLIDTLQKQISDLKANIEKTCVEEEKLSNCIEALRKLLRLLQKEDHIIISNEELIILGSAKKTEEKIPVMQKLTEGFDKVISEVRNKDALLQVNMDNLSSEINNLQEKLASLNQKKLQFPWYTEKLKQVVEKEFAARGIESKVYITAELLEITDERWQNAVEGYLNTQKFNLIVEPQYYDIALKAYHRHQKEIHTAGLVNTRKIKMDYEMNRHSLAYVVHSENRYAKAYANYLLMRVIRSEDIYDLENHSIAITPDCMLYQGYTVRNIDKEIYKDPYIGQNAYRVQIINVKNELEEKSGQRKKLREEKQIYTEILEADKKVNLELMQKYLEAPLLKLRYETELKTAEAELNKAEKDPTLIELNMQIDACRSEKKQLTLKKDNISSEIGKLGTKIEQNNSFADNYQEQLNYDTKSFEKKSDDYPLELKEAEEKYQQNRKTKSPKIIADNFAPKGTQFSNEKENYLSGDGGLKDLQNQYNVKFEQDFLRGTEGISDYIDAKRKLESIDMIRFEEQLRKTKEECEEIYKSDFLAKMKENIENAKYEFKNLNKALKDIYYGEDSYHFEITYDKKKESLYRMITSENNQEGFNLWTPAFEAEYKEEMADLFEKLTAKDDKGEKVIEEYTDYRSYLDYDIEIRKKNGTKQSFSVIYGEKSGSETQVPYYVTIAASFYQLYRLGNTVRLMLLDEAFDKMDDERISSMMDFFNSLGLQVIMATPPAKIEVIGEKADTILTAHRIGERSIVEEYDL